MIYAITYDLKKFGQDYNSLYNEIKSLGEAIKPLQNLWLLSSNSSLEFILDRLHSKVDSNDYIFVIELKWGNYKAWMDVSDHRWLEAKL